TANAQPTDQTPGDNPATTAPSIEPSTNPATVDTTTAPRLDGPASKYSLLNPDDFGTGYITDIRNTYVLDAENYTAHNEAFASPAEGRAMMEGWGYQDGYSTAVDPEGRLEGMLNGGIRVLLEVHLFETEEGADAAYTYFAEHIGSSGLVISADPGPVGNESSAWAYTSGKIGNSNVNMAFQVLMFRRGNLLASVVAIGAEPFVRAEHARAHALMIDEKALGERAVFTPTPTSNYTPQATQ
ncbi:MAG: hypothetical protein M0R74_14460, partial [Dehalococcoidia bacterium]|nr:hypothetical protein [Dehalococcoidia bacterium]